MSLSKMVNPIGVRFCPTDEEIFDYYLRVKNLETNTSHVDEVISTVNICSSDPWHLPSMATTIVNTTDLVWYFFGRIEKKYNRGDRQNRKTKSGYWKKTGVTVDIKRESGNREKLGEKRFLTFYFEGGFKSKWNMHEYHATFFSPNQMMMMTYTLCKVEFKGDISCYVLENPCQITESPDLDALDWVMCNILNPDFVGLADDDEVQESRSLTIKKHQRKRRR